MKKIFLLLLAAAFTQTGFAQEKKTADNSVKEVTVGTYSPFIKSGEHLYLKMQYGSAVITNPEEFKKLSIAKVAAVEVVFSDDPKGESFADLNEARIENVKKLSPTLFADKTIQWKLVRQTACKDKRSASKLFHGIVITYRPIPTKKEMEKEITYLKDMVSKLSSTTAPKLPGATKASIGLDEVIGIEADYLLDSGKIGVSTSRGKPGEIFIYPVSEPGSISAYYPEGFGDSSVTAVLNRNKWKGMIITADLTGSMSPYTAQLFVWLRLNTIDTRVKQFVFFNDGDMTPDNKKVIGKTGGIYDTKSSKFEDVEKLAYTTMTHGGGGDAPENDIEALIKAIDLAPESKNIVLIADNWAPVKDISLASKIKKPVKIILCGADYGINPEYLTLARMTGGSVHTMSEDLTNLMKLKEGEQITIHGQVFKIEKGRFVRLMKG